MSAEANMVHRITYTNGDERIVEGAVILADLGIKDLRDVRSIVRIDGTHGDALPAIARQALLVLLDNAAAGATPDPELVRHLRELAGL